MTVLAADQLVIDIPGRNSGVPLNLAAQPGQVWAVLGPNGTGKTTLLHTLAGLYPARSGRVLLDDQPVSAMARKAVSRKLGLVFQDRQDGFPATVLETVLIGRHPWLASWKMEGAEDLAAAERALEALDVAHLRDRLVNTLSGGERQRVAIATLMTQNPDVWLLDEPGNHLDLHHQVAVMGLLQAQANMGKTVFLCLHDLNLAARWCSHVLLLYPGGDACWGPAQSMLVPAALERLYSQKLITVEADGAPVFVPAR